MTDLIQSALARAQEAAQARCLNEALGICEDVLAAHPGQAGALAIQGTLHAQAGRLETGIALLERACAAEPTVPGWHANLCAIYRLAGRPDDALAAGLRAVSLNAETSQYLMNLALAQIDLNLRDEAVPTLLRAIGLKHDDAGAHLALAQLLLARGDYGPGWIEYEWRNLTEAARGTMPATTSAPWNGMALPGGRLLLVGDQGYGDTIQFARYIPLAAARCDEVLLGCSPELAALVGRVPGVGRCITNWNEVPGHAAFCRLSSLPGLFGTTPASIPGPHPYLFADPARVARWASRLDKLAPRRAPRVGLAWTGRPTHPNDSRRSIRLAQLFPLVEAAPDVAFICLQKPLPDVDRPLMDRFGMVDLSGELADFEETAALLVNLDLLITVDTAVGHLAGALGRPAWLLLGQAPDWRWLVDRADSPWYPTLRLFRQRRAGVWDAPVAEVATALAAYEQTHDGRG